MNNSMRSDRGYTLLEQALVLPLLVVLISVAVDVTHVAQSYSALRQGVKTSIRCLYPTDSDCVQVHTSAPNALYEVTRYDATDDLFIKQENYEGVGYHIVKPQYTLSNYHALVLGQGNYTETTWTHSAQERFFEGVGSSSSTIVKSFIPYVEGSHLGSLSFKYKNEQGTAYPATFNAQVASLGGTLLDGADRWVSASNPTRNLGYVEVAMPPAPTPEGYDSNSCYRSNSFNTNQDNQPDLNAPCSSLENFLFNQGKTRAVVYLKGNSQGSVDYGEASIGVIIRRWNGSSWELYKDIGGRHYTSTAGLGRDASLAPRGLFNLTFADPDIQQYQELTLHSPINLEYGQTYRFKFTLNHMGGPAGRVYYNPTRIKIFGINFDANGVNSTHACTNALLPHQDGDVAACNTNPPVQLTSLNLNYDNVVATGNVQGLGTYNTDVINYAQALEDQVQYPQDYFPLTPVATDHERSIACPGAGSGGNFGVPEQAQNGIITNSASAQTICPIPDEPNYSNPRWTEVNVVVPGNPTTTWVRDNCSDFPDPKAELPELAPYIKLLTDNTVSYSGNSQEKIYTGQGPADTHHPQNVIASQYSCNDSLGGEFTLGSQMFSEQEPEGPHLFQGYHYPIGCDYETILRDEAIDLGMDANSYFEAEEPTYGASIEPTQGVVDCAVIDPTTGTRENPVFLGTFLQGDIPAECYTPGYVCDISFAGFDGDPSDGNDVELDFEYAAQNYFATEVAVANPTAKFNCEGQDCYNVAIQADSETVTVSGSTQVGLFNIFGAPVELPITYAETETLEAIF
ncbi:MAG: hypothetical protein KDD55_01640 [Bdellovibrionales bacterium]|nr:hypothetical protein [Bdellovibrionales bacterium]